MVRSRKVRGAQSDTERNTGKRYELLAEAICRSINNKRGVYTLEPPKNRVIKSAATTHQIDVHWTFQLDDAKHTVLIQCKDWKHRVPKVEMLAFAMIVNLLGENAHGIFIARSGFQSGAIEVAKYFGIEVYDLGAPKNDENWDGINRKISINIEAKGPGVRNSKPIFDREWIAEEYRKQGITKDTTSYPNDEDYTNRYLFLLDENGEGVVNFGTFLYGMCAALIGQIEEGPMALTFDPPLFVPNRDGEAVELLKVIGAEFTYAGVVTHAATSIELKADEIVANILRNMIPGSTNGILTDRVLAIDKSGEAIM